MVDGKLYGVSVGPGDPELLTLKAFNILKSTNCWIVPKSKSCSYSTVLDIVLNSGLTEPENIIELNIPMTKDTKILDSFYKDFCNRIFDVLDEGINISYLCLGDISIYSSFTKLEKYVKALGKECIRIPGVPSFCDVASKLGVSLVDRNEALHILSGNNLNNLDLKGNKVIMKSASNTEELFNVLDKDEFVGAVSDSGTKKQKIILEMDDLNNNTSYFTTLILKEKAE